MLLSLSEEPSASILRVEDGGGRFIENIGNYVLSFMLKMEVTASSDMLVIAYQVAQYPSGDHHLNSHYYKILMCVGMLTVLNLLVHIQVM
jgi:hypothetical protein